MNWIDITILVLLAVATIKGLFDGFIKQVSSLLGIGLGIAFAGMFFRVFDPLFLRFAPGIPQVIATILGYIIAFLIIFVVVKLVGLLMKKICNAIFLGPVDTLLGGGVGILTCLLVVSLLLNAIDRIDPESQHLIPRTVKEKSYLYGNIKSIVPAIYHLNWFDNQPQPQKQNRPEGVTV